MNDYLWSVEGSGFHAVGCSSAAFERLRSALQEQRQDAVVRTIEGNRSRTLADFFTESAAALEFPAYFGHNWSAFNDSILDLDWLPASAYVLLFADAHLLLDQAGPNNLTTLAMLLSEARDAWQPSPEQVPGVQPIPFHGVFQAPPEHIDHLKARLTEAGFVLDPAWHGEALLD